MTKNLLYKNLNKASIDVCRNIEARSRNHCCSGKEIVITYSECVFVALGIQHAMRMRHIVICDLPRSTTFFHNGMILEKKTLLNIKYVLGFFKCVISVVLVQ